MVDEKQYYHAAWKTSSFTSQWDCMSQRCSYETVVSLLERRLDDTTDFDVDFMICPAPIGLVCQCVAEAMRPDGFYYTRVEGAQVRVAYMRKKC